ncbi:MAG: HAD family phosphatase [Clostridia bacterium]|nr:HAD family phosphatase [Clostridia bacterium]
MQCRYAIFDLDGTLVDSMGYWGEVCRDLLRQYGVEEDAQLLTERTAMMTAAEAAAWLVEAYRLPAETADILEKTDRLLCRLYREVVPAKPGVAAYLKRLQARGVTMCVASASPAGDIRDCLARLGLLSYFSFILSCDEVGAGKASPAVYREAARRFGVPPERVAVFEDSLTPLRTAKAAGFYPVAVYDRYARSTWEIAKALAAEAVPDWRTAE